VTPSTQPRAGCTSGSFFGDGWPQPVKRRAERHASKVVFTKSIILILARNIALDSTQPTPSMQSFKRQHVYLAPLIAQHFNNLSFSHYGKP